MSKQQFLHGDRVYYAYSNGFYGMGTVRFLDGDLVPDGSGTYRQPGWVCVEFDREIEGRKRFVWCEMNLLTKVDESV